MNGTFSACYAENVRYIYDHPDWPNFCWDMETLAPQLAAVRYRQGRLLGRMESLGFALGDEAVLRTVEQEALKTSDIEGETLDPGEVRSSIARRLGLDIDGLIPSGRAVDGLVTMLIDATQDFAEPLTVARLCSWHSGLFPTGDLGRHPITVGAWRTDELDPMQVVSGSERRQIIHFRAPPASRIGTEIGKFLAWVENPGNGGDPVLKAAVAHIWFVTIHPFDDGNGRIARAVADLLLARAEGTGRRFYSLSARLRIERNAYYETLEATQKGDLDITARLAWFLRVLDEALADAETTLEAVLRKARFWEALRDHPINPRQRKLLIRLLDGFTGKLTSSKWATIAKCSQDTALRDIDDLIGRGLLVKAPSGGRNTHYLLAE